MSGESRNPDVNSWMLRQIPANLLGPQVQHLRAQRVPRIGVVHLRVGCDAMPGDAWVLGDETLVVIGALLILGQLDLGGDRHDPPLPGIAVLVPCDPVGHVEVGINPHGSGDSRGVLVAPFSLDRDVILPGEVPDDSQPVAQRIPVLAPRCVRRIGHHQQMPPYPVGWLRTDWTRACSRSAR